MGFHKVQFCPKGHDTFKLGRTKSRPDRGGFCKECSSITIRQIHWKKWGFLNYDGSPFSYSDYNKMFQEQDGKCAICDKHQSNIKGRLQTDHNHTTMIVRGLLCIGCNTKVGSIESSIYSKILDYIKRGI